MSINEGHLGIRDCRAISQDTAAWHGICDAAMGLCTLLSHVYVSVSFTEGSSVFIREGQVDLQ